MQSIENGSGKFSSGVLGIVCLSILFGCGSPPSPEGAPAGPAAVGAPGGAPADAGGASLTVAGPFTHENLSVYVLSSAQPDRRQFITLDEGLKSGAVAVSEKENAEVGELLIDNRSDLPLFLQEGDRLYGGKQDRTFITSLVVPPRSGQLPVPAMCIEPGRWVAGESGIKFEHFALSSASLAPKEVRYAAKLEMDQGKVWESVNEIRTNYRQVFGLTGIDIESTSLNRTLDSPRVKDSIAPYRQALEKVLEKHPDASGVAIAVNGKVEEIDLYPGPSLLAKLYPRLLESFAFQAAVRKPETAAAKLPEPAEIVKLLREGRETSKQDRAIDAANVLSVSDLGDSVRCSTAFQGRVIHEQWLSK